MNRFRTADFPITPLAQKHAGSTWCNLQKALIHLHIRTTQSAALFRLQRLNYIRKGLPLRRKRHRYASGASQNSHSIDRCNDCPPQNRPRRTGMALKVELKPNERIIIGACVITNTEQRARLLIDGDNIPILREKDILTPATADTPAKLVYLAVQLMYISPDPEANHGTYFNLVRDIVTAVPSAWPIIEEINNNILGGNMYQALKEAKKLVAYEKKLLDHHEAQRAKREAEARRSA
jgi:flagellar protein FlbT